jgi:hypothetical protein
MHSFHWGSFLCLWGYGGSSATHGTLISFKRTHETVSGKKNFDTTKDYRHYSTLGGATNVVPSRKNFFLKNDPLGVILCGESIPRIPEA